MRRDQPQRAARNRIALLRQRACIAERQAQQPNRKRDPGRALHQTSPYLECVTNHEWLKTLSIREISGVNALVSRSSRAMMAMETGGRSGSTPGSSITSGGVTTERGSAK